MSTYTIGQVAERSGFSASALRYYETHGLLDPVGRTDAGYRLYDDSSLERLRFIARGKELGCSLEEIADLAELWEAADCAPVQARLHQLMTNKIDDTQRRSAELIQFTAQLHTAAAHLGAAPIDGPCGDGCACLPSHDPTPASDAQLPTTSVPVILGQQADPVLACTLPAEEMHARADAWLAVAEQGCCTFFAFAITVDHRGIALEVRAPNDAADIITAVFGAAA